MTESASSACGDSKVTASRPAVTSRALDSQAPRCLASVLFHKRRFLVLIHKGC